MVEYPIAVYDAPVWTVYMHVNKVNGKKYVGITSRNPNKKWKKNGEGYKPAHGNNNHFYNAIQKYGWNNFNHYILINQINSDLASIYERILIIYYGTLEPNGYNAKLGGQLGTFGTKYSEQYAEKKRGYNSSCSLEVICLNTGVKYGSAAEAERKTTSKSVAHACREGKYSGIDQNGEPLRWMYVKDYATKTQQEIDDFMNSRPKMNTRKQIICLNTNELFNSALQALKISDASQSYGIHRTCRGEQKYSGHHILSGEPLRWMYYDDYLNKKGGIV